MRWILLVERVVYLISFMILHSHSMGIVVVARSYSILSLRIWVWRIFWRIMLYHFGLVGGSHCMFIQCRYNLFAALNCISFHSLRHAAGQHNTASFWTLWTIEPHLVLHAFGCNFVGFCFDGLVIFVRHNFQFSCPYNIHWGQVIILWSPHPIPFPTLSDFWLLTIMFRPLPHIFGLLLLCRPSVFMFFILTFPHMLMVTMWSR